MKTICTYSILQKYYSALNNLVELVHQKSIFDNISNLDSFFSEFRSITLVMQKIFNGQDELKSYYNNKRDEILVKNQDMKWFVDCRNRTTKEEPFKLEKIIIVDAYLPSHSETIYDDRLTTDNDTSFETIINNLNPVLITYSKKYVDLFFCITLSYRENNKEVNIHEKIISGIQTMHKFILAILEDFPCLCSKCTHHKNNIFEAYSKVLLNKKFLFTWDCSFENDKIIFGRQIECMFSDGKNIIFLDETKTPLLGSLFEPTECTECTENKILQVYQKFTFFHIHMYKAQNLEIMPTFMILFKDDTFCLKSYVSTTKTTTYRIISEIAQLVRENSIVAVLYVGEYYSYDLKNATNIINKSYNERIKSADFTGLSCKMMTKQYASILTVDLDSIIIKDQELHSIFQKITPKKENNLYSSFNPILQSFHLKNID